MNSISVSGSIPVFNFRNSLFVWSWYQILNYSLFFLLFYFFNLTLPYSRSIIWPIFFFMCFQIGCVVNFVSTIGPIIGGKTMRTFGRVHRLLPKLVTGIRRAKYFHVLLQLLRSHWFGSAPSSVRYFLCTRHKLQADS